MAQWWRGLRQLLDPRASDRSVQRRVTEEMLGSDREVEHAPEITSNQVAAGAYLATNTIGRLIEGSRRERARLRAALLAAADGVLAARSALAALIRDHGRDELTAAADRRPRRSWKGPAGSTACVCRLHAAVVVVTFIIDDSLFYAADCTTSASAANPRRHTRARLVHDLHVRVLTSRGELVRDPTRDYPPRART